MRVLVLTLIASLISSTTLALSAEAAPAAKVEQEASDWRKVAEAVPLGSKVKVQRLNGERVTGTLIRVDGTAVMLKKDTRRPEPAISIPFDEMGKLERAKDGSGAMNVAKVIAIGAAAGAGAMVTLILFALQLD